MMSIRLAPEENRDSDTEDSAALRSHRRLFVTRSKVFKFATKAVREALSMNSMTSAMEYLEVSSLVANTPEDTEKLLKLTDEAIGELQASTTEDIGDAIQFSTWEVGDAELLDFREKITSKLFTCEGERNDNSFHSQR